MQSEPPDEGKRHFATMYGASRCTGDLYIQEQQKDVRHSRPAVGMSSAHTCLPWPCPLIRKQWSPLPFIHRRNQSQADTRRPRGYARRFEPPYCLSALSIQLPQAPDLPSPGHRAFTPQFQGIPQATVSLVPHSPNTCVIRWSRGLQFPPSEVLLRA